MSSPVPVFSVGCGRWRWLLAFVALHLAGLLLPVIGYLGWLLPAERNVSSRELEVFGVVSSMSAQYDQVEGMVEGKNHFDSGPGQRVAAAAYHQGMRDLSPRYSAWMGAIAGPEMRAATRAYAGCFGVGTCVAFVGLVVSLVLGSGMSGLRGVVACSVVGAIWGGAAGALADGFPFDVSFIPAIPASPNHSGLIGGTIVFAFTGLVLGWITGHLVNRRGWTAEPGTRR